MYKKLLYISLKYYFEILLNKIKSTQILININDIDKTNNICESNEDNNLIVKSDIELKNQLSSNANIYKILDQKLKEIIDI